MTEHLPECPISIGDMSVTVDGVTSTVFYYCACPSVRRCEQRVREEERNKWSDLAHDNWQGGWEEGLHAARKAVVDAKSVDVSRMYALDSPAIFIWLHDALAAIDALKEKP